MTHTYDSYNAYIPLSRWRLLSQVSFHHFAVLPAWSVFIASHHWPTSQESQNNFIFILQLTCKSVSSLDKSREKSFLTHSWTSSHFSSSQSFEYPAKVPLWVCQQPNQFLPIQQHRLYYSEKHFLFSRQQKINIVIPINNNSNQYFFSYF